MEGTGFLHPACLLEMLAGRQPGRFFLVSKLDGILKHEKSESKVQL